MLLDTSRRHTTSTGIRFLVEASVGLGDFNLVASMRLVFVLRVSHSICILFMITYFNLTDRITKEGHSMKTNSIQQHHLEIRLILWIHLIFWIRLIGWESTAIQECTYIIFPCVTFTIHNGLCRAVL